MSQKQKKHAAVARWFEAALPQEDRLLESPIYQENPVKAAFFWGHSSNSISEMPRMRQAMEAPIDGSLGAGRRIT